MTSKTMAHKAYVISSCLRASDCHILRQTSNNNHPFPTFPFHPAGECSVNMETSGIDLMGNNPPVDSRSDLMGNNPPVDSGIDLMGNNPPVDFHKRASSGTGAETTQSSKGRQPKKSKTPSTVLQGQWQRPLFNSNTVGLLHTP
jgi:hypothetical protein